MSESTPSSSASGSAPRRGGERVDEVLRGGRVYRRRARLRAVDRGEHGFASYRQGCRCALCREAHAAYHDSRYSAAQVARQGSANRRVDATLAAEHLAELRASGWSVGKVAAEVGCSPSTLTRIARRVRRGERVRVWSTFARALLELEPKPRKPKREPARAPRRRVAPLEVVEPLEAAELDGLAARGYGKLFR